MSEINGDPVDATVEQFLRHLEDRTTPPSLSGLTEAERSEASAILQLLEACWGAASLEVPPIENDPLAVELGLVTRPAAFVSIKGRAVKAARKQRKADILIVAEALSRAGHPVDVRWMFDLEQAPTKEVPADLAEALGQVLGVRLGDLVATELSPEQHSLDWFLGSQLFRGKVERWSQSTGMDVQVAKALFASKLSGAACRTSGTPDENEWARLLDALMESQRP